MLDILIANGVDVNHQSENGDTALHYAVVSGSLDAVITLGAAGADPNIQVRPPSFITQKNCFSNFVLALFFLMFDYY